MTDDLDEHELRRVLSRHGSHPTPVVMRTVRNVHTFNNLVRPWAEAVFMVASMGLIVGGIVTGLYFILTGATCQ